MMSGRGLGHTGGTLDKLEAIPGFRTALSLDELRDAVGAIGCAMIGQTSEIAPADRRLYALRDVTGTVESIPLISASIMSKKIAEGIGGLVLDVKTGDGAFMKTEERSRALADSLVAIGEAAGVRTEALITRMDAPLGRAVGNASEVVESIETLKGQGPRDLEELSVVLAARMLVAAGVEKDDVAAERRVRAALASGAGVEKFREIIARQGGDPRVIDDYTRLPSAPDRTDVAAPRSGFVARLAAETIGRAAVALGAGRSRLDDVIDPGVGIEVRARPGDPVERGAAGPDDSSSWRARARRGDGDAGAVNRGVGPGAGGCRSDRRAHLGRAAMTQAGVEVPHDAPRRAPFEQRDALVLASAAAVAAVCAAAVHWGNLPRLQPLVGLLVILGIAYACSTNRRAIDRRTVAWGLSLQILFALLVLKTAIGQKVFQTLGGLINRLLDFAFVGSAFVFGPMGDKVVWPRIMTQVLGPEGAQYGVIFAFQVLPTIIFIAALFAILYYFGVMQVVVRVFAILMRRVMRASGAESLNVAASHLHGADRGAADHPALPAADDRVRADDGDDVRHGAHLRRDHGGVHPVRHRSAAPADRGDHDGARHADDGKDLRSGDGACRRRWVPCASRSSGRTSTSSMQPAAALARDCRSHSTSARC